MKTFKVIIDIDSFYTEVKAENEEEAIKEALKTFNVEDQNYHVGEVNEIEDFNSEICNKCHGKIHGGYCNCFIK